MSDTNLSALLDRERLPLLYHTARNMRARQLAGIGERKARHLLVPALPVDFDARYERAAPETGSAYTAPLSNNAAVLRDTLEPSVRDGYRDAAQGLTDGEVTFRNRTVSVASPSGVDWTGTGVPAPSTLWGLQFHGLAFLSWPVLGYETPDDCPSVDETVQRWLRDWDETDSNRIGQPGYLRGSWTPHAVSLRLLNLCRYYAWADAELDPVEADRLRGLVGKNAAFLSNHVEHEVGGNHLIENGAALVMAGLFLSDAGDEWLQQGVDVLRSTAQQFRADGGHFECSPMYHAVTVTRYLTVIDLLQRAGRPVPGELRRVAAEGVRYLQAMRPPDGRLPLLNDSVFGLAIPLGSCLAYAREIGVFPEESSDDALPATGYYWFGSGDSRLLVDGGAIGPAHLPAHSHNDHFAVLWWADGQRILTDTGVFEYLPSEERQHARSVSAHNTVQYDDVEPIQTGGSYLFGRRIDPSVEYGSTDGVRYFDGRYRSESPGPQYGHRRQIYNTDDWWLVWDTVSAEESAPVRSRLHLAPGVTVETETNGDQRQVAVHTRGDATPRIVPLETARLSREEKPYYPEFGRSVPRTRVTLRADGADVSFGFLLQSDGADSVEVIRSGSEVTGLQIGDTVHDLPAIGAE